MHDHPNWPAVGEYRVAGPASPQDSAAGRPAPSRLGAEPVCGHDGCAAVPVVHWSRRLSDAELAAIPPEQHTDDMRVLVYACAEHAIGIEEAALIHAADCSAPSVEHLPGCDCAPVPEPQPEVRPVQTLSTGWQITT